MTTSTATMKSWAGHLLPALMLVVAACSSQVEGSGAQPPAGHETAGMSGAVRPAPPPPPENPDSTIGPTPADPAPQPALTGGGAPAPIDHPRRHSLEFHVPGGIALPSASPPAAQPFCEIIGDAATPEECARITAYRDNLKTGSAAFNAPARMLRGETVLLRLVIDKAANSAAPAAAVDALPGATTGFATKVGRYMRAELSGDGFKVAPRDADPSRDLFAATQAQWEWDVTALTGGDHVLTLKTFVQVVDSAGNKQPMGEIVTENRPIHVDVDTAGKSSDFIDGTIGWFGKGTNLLKALATLLGAALAAWLAFRKFRS